MEIGNGDSKEASTITVQVKFGGRTIPLSISSDSTVKDLKSLLQPLTNVLPRGQKLIFKGKILADTTTLKSSELSESSKVMLVASQGVHQGDGPITFNNSENIRKNANVNRVRPLLSSAAAKLSVEKSRSERWKSTGVIALSECQLKVIPEEVWACGIKARFLDLSHNYIEEVPANISSLASISKLFLNANRLSDEGVKWEAISCLKFLTCLNLSQNHLTNLPSLLCTFTSLVQLDVTSNKLTRLPDEMGSLIHLQVLKAGNNRIASIPSSIGNCLSIVEIDLSSNLVDCLPDSLGSLGNLKANYWRKAPKIPWHLHKFPCCLNPKSIYLVVFFMSNCLVLRNNGIRSLPATLLKMCTQLSTLDLHGTQITNDVLRQLEGWDAFDERRRSKHQKQLDFRVGSAEKFEEGADKDNGP